MAGAEDTRILAAQVLNRVSGMSGKGRIEVDDAVVPIGNQDRFPIVFEPKFLT
jgi:hypothetical protein